MTQIYFAPMKNVQPCTLKKAMKKTEEERFSLPTKEYGLHSCNTTNTECTGECEYIM